MKNAIIVLVTCFAFQTLSAQNFWQQVNGPSGFAYFDLLASNASGHIFAAYEHVFRSTDNGNSWSASDSGLPASWYSTAIAISPEGTIFLGLFDKSARRHCLFRSTNNGDNWFASDSGLSSASWVWDIGFAPNGYLFLASGSDFVTSRIAARMLPNGHIFLASGNDWPLENSNSSNGYLGMFRSTDGGSSWAHVGLTGPYSIAISNSGVIFAGDRFARFRSTDNGSTWQMLSLSTGGRGFTRNSSDCIFAFGESRTMRSKDDGNTWSQFCTLPVRAMSFNSNREAFVGNTSGVFRSTDDGVTWSAISQGLTTTNVRSLEINTSGYLFAATDSGGSGRLFRSVSPITDVQPKKSDLPTTFVLNQNYPNPFNPSTRVAFSIHAAGNVTLKVYDILGREARTLVNENLQAGSYEVTFNAEGLASGVYFYQLRADRFVETKKLLLMR